MRAYSFRDRAVNLLHELGENSITNTGIESYQVDPPEIQREKELRKLVKQLFIVAANMDIERELGGIEFPEMRPYEMSAQRLELKATLQVEMSLKPSWEHAGQITCYRLGIQNRKTNKAIENIKVRVVEPKPEWMIHAGSTQAFPFRLWRGEIGSEPDGCSVNPLDTEWFDFMRWWISAGGATMIQLGNSSPLEAPVNPWILTIAVNWNDGMVERKVSVRRIGSKLQVELEQG